MKSLSSTAMGYLMYPMVAASAWTPTTSPFAQRLDMTSKLQGPSPIWRQHFTLSIFLLRNQQELLWNPLALGGCV